MFRGQSKTTTLIYALSIKYSKSVHENYSTYIDLRNNITFEISLINLQILQRRKVSRENYLPISIEVIATVMICLADAISKNEIKYFMNTHGKNIDILHLI